MVGGRDREPAGGFNRVGRPWFRNDNQFLAGAGSHSGPWLKVQGDGSITLYGGSGENNPMTVPSAYTNSGSPVRFMLTYDKFTASASVAVLANGATNTILNTVPITNTLSTITARYLIFQFPFYQAGSNPLPPISRWVTDVTVDWFPRPKPLLTLPAAAPENIVFVGAPTDSDINLIQGKLDKVATNTSVAEIRFQAGATYIITNASTASGVPLSLQHATNILVTAMAARSSSRIHILDFSIFICAKTSSCRVSRWITTRYPSRKEP